MWLLNAYEVLLFSLSGGCPSPLHPGRERGRKKTIFFLGRSWGCGLVKQGIFGCSQCPLVGKMLTTSAHAYAPGYVLAHQGKLLVVSKCKFNL